MQSTRTWPIALAGSAVVASAVAVMAGAAVWLLLVAAVVPCVMAARNRLGSLTAITSVIIGGLWLLLALLITVAVIRVPLLLSVIVAVVVVSLTACWMWWRGPRPRFPAWQSRVLAAPVCAGSVVWLAASITTALRRPVAGLSWAMHGDAASYLLYARTATRDGGIVFGPASNPVPLPAALFALFMAPGRGAVSAAALLRHDLAAYESLQILVIATSCLTAGLLAGTMARHLTSRSLIAPVAGAAGSLLGLSWEMTTNALTYGYFDAQLVLPVLLASVALAFAARDHPLVLITLLLLSCTVVLAVWSPLVVVPGGLLVFTVVRRWHLLRGVRGRRLVVPLVAVTQLLLWGLLVTLPSVLAQGHFLTTQGAIFTFTHSLFPALGVITILLAIIAIVVDRVPGAGVAVVVPLALAVGLAVLLWMNRGAAGLFSYFQVKFEWLSVAVLLVLMLGFLPAVLLPWMARRWAPPIAVIAMLAMTAIVLMSAPDESESNLLVWISQSPATSDGGAPVASEILSASDPAKPTIYWRSAEPNERYLNYWSIELASRSMSNNALRTYAFHYSEVGVKDLCAIIARTPGRMTVRTRDTGLASELAEACPSRSPRVVLLPHASSQ